jgi:hypothetical protein
MTEPVIASGEAGALASSPPAGRSWAPELDPEPEEPPEAVPPELDEVADPAPPLELDSSPPGPRAPAG